MWLPNDNSGDDVQIRPGAKSMAWTESDLSPARRASSVVSLKEK